MKIKSGKINGKVLNLNFFLGGDVFSMKGDEDANYRVQTKRTFYMKALANSTFVFSLDKMTWKSFDGFFRGNIKANLLPGNQDAEHVANFTCKMNFK